MSGMTLSRLTSETKFARDRGRAVPPFGAKPPAVEGSPSTRDARAAEPTAGVPLAQGRPIDIMERAPGLNTVPGAADAHGGAETAQASGPSEIESPQFTRMAEALVAAAGGTCKFIPGENAEDGVIEYRPTPASPFSLKLWPGQDGHTFTVLMRYPAPEFGRPFEDVFRCSDSPATLRAYVKRFMREAAATGLHRVMVLQANGRETSGIGKVAVWSVPITASVAAYSLGTGLPIVAGVMVAGAAAIKLGNMVAEALFQKRMTDHRRDLESLALQYRALPAAW